MKFCYSIVLAIATATAVTGDKHASAGQTSAKKKHDTRNLRGSDIDGSGIGTHDEHPILGPGGGEDPGFGRKGNDDGKRRWLFGPGGGEDLGFGCPGRNGGKRRGLLGPNGGEDPGFGPSGGNNGKHL